MEETEKRNKMIELRLSNVGTGYGIKQTKPMLNTEHLRTPTIAVTIPTIILGY